MGNLFELEDLGGKHLKGIEAPERVWAVLRANLVDSRFDAFQTSGVTELVGRQEELELLQRRWTKAVTGEGQVVLLSGEPGIGKSRLTAALLERLSTEPHTRLRYFCSPQHTDSVLYPIIAQMERAARFAHDDTAQTKLEKLDALLSQSFTPPQDRALFAELLSLRSDSLLPKLDLTPQQRRERTFEALTTQIASLAEQRPVLMIFEDIQWIDPTSLEALGRGIDRIKSVSVLLIITHRTEFEPPWLGRPYVTALGLNRLGKRESASMIDHVAGNDALPETMRQDIIERTDGIPLFVEEMTRAVLEAESEVDGRKTVTAFPSSAIAVPASLHAYLMARLDRLGPAREVAQIGAAIGREFSHALLAAVALKDEKALQSALDALTSSGLLFQQGVTPNATYLFKHALVQDAAYGTLLREPRRALHARITKTLESQFAEIADNQPELLARHSTEAGLIEKAASLWGNAGQRSLARSALAEAAEQLSRALEQIATLPATPALRKEQIRLQVALIHPLFHIRGFAAPETKAAAEQARLLIEKAEALGEPLEDPLLLFSVLFGFWVANYLAFNGDVMRDLATQFLTLAKRQGTKIPRMMGHHVMGISLAATGDLVHGLTHFDRGVALYDPEQHRPLATRFGADVRVANVSFRSWAQWMRGYPEAALADNERALEDAREIAQAATLMVALFCASLVCTLCGKYAQATALSEELIAVAEQQGALFWKSFGTSIQGWVFGLTAMPLDAIRMLTSGISALQSTGARATVPISLARLATAHAEVAQFENAWRCLGDATTAIQKTKETWWEAEVSRVAGEIALKPREPDPAKAEAYFERALEVARQQQAKSWELRAAISLARLWRSQGKVQEARELLAPVYGWFTEGFDTRDLKEAKALLEELA